MGISTFQFKQLFNLLSNPLNTNISETANFFMKSFENSSVFGQYGISTNTASFGASKKAGEMM